MNQTTSYRLLSVLLACALAACSEKKDAPLPPAGEPAAQAAAAPATPSAAPAAPAEAAASTAPPAIAKKATLDCDDRTIVLEANCSALYGPGLLACDTQSLTFIERTDGATKSVRRFNPQPARAGDPPQVEEKIGTLSCVKSDTNERYVVANMFNGGNCPECEWNEAYDWNGKLVATDRDRSKPNALLDGLVSAVDQSGERLIGNKALDGFYSAPAK